LVACCNSFVYFVFFLHYMVTNGYTAYDEAGGWWLALATCVESVVFRTFNGEFAWNNGEFVRVMANFLE
jgi:hypothetical protein